MGKLKYTLTYILFWVIIIFSCLLAENIALLSSDHMGGMNMTSLYLLTFFIIFMLAYYFFREWKSNQIKIDKVLLPIIAAFGLVSILTVWWQGPREFINADGFSTSVSFSVKEKISYTFQIAVWCAVLYGLLFVNNRYSISRKWLKWLPLVYVWGILACTIVDFFMEISTIGAIFAGTYEGNGIQFVIYNSNVWAHLILTGLLSCIVMNLKKFKLVYYFIMIHLFIMIIFTSCATAFFVGLVAMVAYSLYEILSLIKTQKNKSIKLLVVYLSGITIFFSIFAILVLLNVPIFSNFWQYVSGQIIQKDYNTLTSRTSIWASIFELLCKNPIDLIFGLGYKTGNKIFTQYFLAYNSHGFEIRSAHNGEMEIILRHGLFGLSFYIAAFILFARGISALVKRKQYRIAYFYLLCVVGLLIHSVAESTMFLTPNIGGTYATLVFFLPVANETKRKYFLELNADLQEAEENTSGDKNSLLYFINTLTIGLIIALVVSLPIKFLYSEIAMLIVYLGLIGLSLVSLLVAPVIMSKITKMSYKELVSLCVIKPIKDNYIAVLLSLVGGLVFAIALPSIGNFDAFVTLLYTLCVFVLFIFAFSLFHKKENNQTIDLFNNKFRSLLRKVSGEVSYE